MASSTPSNVLDVGQICEEHDERYVMFCKQHDAHCCKTCSLENHKQCQGYIFKIDDVVKNIKVSHIFQETEHTLTELSDNIKKIQKDRKQNLVSLDNSKIQIEREIQELRVKVNDRLDKLQKDIMKKLNKAEEIERKSIQKIVDEFEEKEKHINEMQVNLSNIKQHASDLKAYFAMKKIKDDVGQIDITIDTIIASDALHQKVLSLEIDTAMEDIVSGIKRFGNITVETKGCTVVITKKKNQQAQFLVPYQARTIDDITLQLQQTLDVDSSWIQGCCTLPDGTFVFTSYYKSNKLILINADGTYNTTLSTPSKAFDVIYVKYNNSLAVTSGYSSNHCITFIDIKSKKVEEVIKLKSKSYGIAVKDDTLFFCTDDCIMSLNLKDKSITKFKDFKLANYTYIDVFENNLYHTRWNTNTITCYDLSGDVKWEFKDENAIKKVMGITVDNRGNVYVAGYLTSNVVVISPDGQRYSELLSTRDKLVKPSALHYDRSTDNLLVDNEENKKAFVYKVI